jgi:hypothetical protein
VSKRLYILILFLGLGGPGLSAKCSPDTAPAACCPKHPAPDSKDAVRLFPPAFDRERGVSWDGQIAWKAEERAWAFAAALEDSLKGIIRANSPFHLNVAVVRVEKQTGTFVVEFGIQAPSGENVELVQVEGVGPRNLSTEEIYPFVAAEIVTTFEKSVLK